MNILNLASNDPMIHLEEEMRLTGKLSMQKVHIHIRKRNARKATTVITDLDTKLNLKRLSKTFGKKFCCCHTIVTTKEGDTVIILSGDQRENVKKFLIDEEIYIDEDVIIHGY